MVAARRVRMRPLAPFSKLGDLRRGKRDKLKRWGLFGKAIGWRPPPFGAPWRYYYCWYPLTRALTWIGSFGGSATDVPPFAMVAGRAF